MKTLPYQLQLILACVLFGIVNFGFHAWDKEPLGQAAGEAMITTLIFGIIMHYMGILKKIRKRNIRRK